MTDLHPDGAPDPPMAPAIRTPSDVLRLVAAGATWALLILAELLFGSDIAGFAFDLLRGVDAFGTSVLTSVVVVLRVAGLAALVVLAVAAVHRGGLRVVAGVAVALAVGFGAYAIADATIDADGPALAEIEDVAPPLTSTAFPTSWGLALGVSAAVAMAPWVRRRIRRIAWAAALGTTVATTLVAPLSATPLAALVSGWLGGSAAVVMLGAPSMRPDVSAVVDGLRSVGVDVTDLRPANVDARGSTPYLGRTSAGQRLFVKVLGRDERSADLLFRLYRSLMPTSFGDERPFSSLRRGVEHEAMVSLAVASFGLRTPPVLGFATVEPAAYALAYQGVEGRSLDAVDTSQLTDDVLAQIWAQVATLRAHRAAHRDLRLANLFLDADDDVWLIDFGFAELATTATLLASDVAELMAALVTRLPVEDVVRHARTALGHGALVASVARLEPRLLSGATRHALRARPELLASLRRAIED